MNVEACAIAHQIPEIRCIRALGHDGLCWSKWAAFPGGVVQRTEWKSEQGRFSRHYTYRARYPANAAVAQ